MSFIVQFIPQFVVLLPIVNAVRLEGARLVGVVSVLVTGSGADARIPLHSSYFLLAAACRAVGAWLLEELATCTIVTCTVDSVALVNKTNEQHQNRAYRSRAFSEAAF